MYLQNRRQFLKTSAAGLGTLAFSGFPFSTQALTQDEDHFFIFLLLEGGFDQNYLFDARPLQMTLDKKICNYLEEEPTPWVGSNGQQTLVTGKSKPLEAFKNDFSIINGVLMATAFDGHEQSISYAMTGNPFGGDSYLPKLNKASRYSATVIDGIRGGNGFLFQTPKNFGEMVPLAGADGQRFAQLIKDAAKPSTVSPVFAHILNRLQVNGQSAGRFGKASHRLFKTASSSPQLYELMNNIKFDGGNDRSLEEQFIALCGNLFKNKIARTAFLQLDNGGINVDSHDFDSARNYGDVAENLVSKLIAVITELKNTPYDSQRSLFDVTTFGVCSEFGRTMRSLFAQDFSTSGTDHNPLTNTVLLGGKGIRGGMVIGESDFRASGEGLSAAHQQLDPDSNKVMGRPFDFSKSLPRTDLPAKFATADYIAFPNVANTIMELFGVPKADHWAVDRLSGPAPILRQILT